MNKITKNIAALIAFSIGTTTIGFAQITQQKIGNNPTLINPNAVLEVDSSNKGLLLPRLGLTATNNFAPLAAHVAGMTVYNTTTAGTAPNNVTPGYYYNDGTQWVRVATGADAKTEPWYQQTTANEATANTQNIYQQGKVAVGFTNADAVTGKQFEVKGDFKSQVTAGTTIFGSEVNTALAPGNSQATINYWLNTATGDYRTNLVHSEAAALQAGTIGSNNSIVSVRDDRSTMASLLENGTSKSEIRTLNNGTFFMETYNVASDYGSTISLQNTGLRLVHTTTNGLGDPFPNDSRSEILVQKENGVNFDFKNATGATTGNYWFPLTTGTNGQVMTQTATGKMTWSSPALEPWKVIETGADATLNTENIFQTGNVAIGSSTIPTLTVGAVAVPVKFHVDGNITTTGKIYTTNSVYADYVFEKYFNGSSDINPNYEFKSLNYVKEFIKANNHLPGVTPIDDLNKAENGYTIDMSELTVQSLEKIEELYLHTIEQKETIDQQQTEIDLLKKQAEETKLRLQRLEEILSNKN